MPKIKIAIVGVGNCASSLVQGLGYYSNPETTNGLMMPLIGGYHVADIEVVAVFDIVEGKVGVSLNQAIIAHPNDTLQLDRPPYYISNVIVNRGPTMDGLGRYLRDNVKESSEPLSSNVTDVLRRSGAEIVVNYLPVGSDNATRYYAECAISARCAFVNCMPSFLASDKDWAARFLNAGLPIIGDDVKSQVGATIAHRAMAILMRDRGVQLTNTYQLNVGGNSDFLNMLERERLKSKKISKTRAVTSVAGVTLPVDSVHIGPSDHVPWLTDRKVAFIRLEGSGFGGAPMSIEMKMEVWDSPNSAGVVVDAIRCARVALDRGLAGPVIEPSAYYMKSPPMQYDDSDALDLLRMWLVTD